MRIRFDRSLTLYFFRPLSLLRKPRGLRIPILMYHSICDEPEPGHPYYWINTSPARFAEQMKFLRDNNYQVISLSKAVELIRKQDSSTTGTRDGRHSINQSSNQPRYVVLTFDDGYSDFYTDAFPILRLYSYTATVFLPTAYVNGERPGLKGKRHLDWDNVRELAAQGISFGSHSVNHPQLYGLPWNEIESELRESKAAIDSQLFRLVGLSEPTTNTLEPAMESPYGLPAQPLSVDSFCYPYKFPEQDQAFVSMLGRFLKGSSYTCGTSSRVGSTNTSHDVLSLKRLPVSAADDLDLFRMKLGGAYDWTAYLQQITKKIGTVSRKWCSLKQIVSA